MESFIRSSLQQKELALQRKELVYTREEFRDQNFQTTFFNLQKNQRQIIDGMRIKVPILRKQFKEAIKEVTGRRFFIECKVELMRITAALEFEIYNDYDVEIFHSTLDAIDPEREDIEKVELRMHNLASHAYTLCKYKIDKDEYHSYRSLKNEDKIKFVYQKFLNRYAYAVGHYFRHLYHILLFLENTENERIRRIKLEKGEKMETRVTEVKLEIYGYVQFLKAQMDIPELFTLFYNSFLYPNSKRLLAKYLMLDNLPLRNLLSVDHNIVSEFCLAKDEKFTPEQPQNAPYSPVAPAAIP